MRKSIKGLIAKMLVLCMVVGLLPVVSLAADAGASDLTYQITVDATGGSVRLDYTIGQDTNAYDDFAPDTAYVITGDVTELKFTFTPASYYSFDGATYTIGGDTVAYPFETTDNAGVIPAEAFTAPTENCYTIAVRATFTYVGSGSTGGGGGGGGSSSSSAVKTTSAKNGSFSVSNKNAKAGDTVTVTTKPDEGYVVDEVTVTDKKGNEVEVTRNADGTYSFVMPAKTLQPVTIKVTFREETAADIFTDVSNDTWYSEAVLWAYRNGITLGTGEGLFSPDVTCTRAEMVTFLWRAAGSPKATGSNPFADVAESTYYYDAVLWAAEKGVTKGTGDGVFSPNVTVARDQTVTFLYRYEGAPAVSGANAFTDVDAGAYYADAVQWASKEGVTTGTGEGVFSPSMDCSRAQIVTFLYRDMAD